MDYVANTTPRVCTATARWCADLDRVPVPTPRHSDRNALGLDGAYTNLEVYLAELADPASAANVSLLRGSGSLWLVGALVASATAVLGVRRVGG